VAAPTLADQVAWQRVHGRNDLPWQGRREPYHVWLSEIMLQQTQGYGANTERFPDLDRLAAASLTRCWSVECLLHGAHLHAAVIEVCRDHGVFPRSAELLQTLPGIGRSTAAAIASLCFGERVAILDGNVRRVLCRYLGFDADLSLRANEQALWAHATDLLPTRQLGCSMPRYTQGLMDLGATLCTASQTAPPARWRDCVARRRGAAAFSGQGSSRERPSRLAAVAG
jgi:A/G-specific adenine glycosylase